MSGHGQRAEEAGELRVKRRQPRAKARNATRAARNRLQPLSPLQYDILDALRSLKAIDPEKRATGPVIAGRVGGRTDQSVKAPIADLGRRELVESQTGRHGGTWLTTKGLDYINGLRPKQ